MNENFKNTLNENKTKTWSASAGLVYKCGICGKEFDNIPARAECELKCHKKQEEEKRLAEAKKKKEEQAARKKAVDEAFDKAYKLKKEYIKDYGLYTYSNEDEYDTWKFSEFVRMLP